MIFHYRNHIGKIFTRKTKLPINFFKDCIKIIFTVETALPMHFKNIFMIEISLKMIFTVEIALVHKYFIILNEFY